MQLTHIGERIRAARRSRNMTQEDVADATTISLRTLRRIEHGEVITIEYLMLLAQCLSISIDALLGITPDIATKDNNARNMICRGKEYINPTNRYYCVFVDPEGHRGGITEWIGYKYIDNKEYEVRTLREIDPVYRYDTIYASTFRPPLIINNLDDLDLYNIIGGYALVETSICRSHMQSWYHDYIVPHDPEALRDNMCY